ncbi:MAG: DeoR/GlpR transcriptional regulator [Ruminococcaceae bacterium]|nr:DeoR/GlpR transcriptional regulator [Oscillospiraceae bacterium]
MEENFVMNSERRSIIKEMLCSKPFVSLKELTDLFPEVSSMTIRRDIDYFEQQGDAIKVRGGARSMKFITTSMEEEFPSRMQKNIPAKEALAKKAIEMLETGRSFFLDSGTTMMMMASLLPEERFTITTTGPNIAIELLHKKQTIVNLVGGMLNRDNISVSGTQALRFLDDINIDTAFIVPSGASSQTGLTCGNYSECELKKFIVEKARRVIVLLDTTKYDKSLPYTFGNFKDIYMIITNGRLPEDIAIAADQNGVIVVRA